MLSYFPFEWIAKVSLIVFAALFILDPYPPTSRIVSLLGVVVLRILTKMEKQWRSASQTMTDEGSGDAMTSTPIKKTT